MIKKLFFSGVALIFIFLLPYIILGDNSYVFVHDNLDSNVVWYKVIAESDHMFSSNSTMISGIMGELPRLSFPSEMYVLTWLYYFFTPWAAFLINLILIRLVAFSSLFVLLLEITPAKSKYHLAFVWSFSLLFSFLPFWPSAGLSVAGQPVIICLFILLINKKSLYWPYILLFLYTLYSNLVLSGIFLGFGLFCWLLIHSIKQKKINLQFLLGFLIIVIGYVISDYRLFLSLVGPESFGFTSHRVEMIPSFHNNLFGNIKGYFLDWHYHSAKLPFVFGAIILVTTPLILFKKRSGDRLLHIFLLSTYLCVLLASLSKWEPLSPLYDHFTFFKTFQITRIFFLIPVLVLVTIYLVYVRFFLSNKFLMSLGFLLLFIGFLDIVSMDINIRNSIKQTLGQDVKDPTFQEFYSETLFDKIKKRMPEENPEVLTFGIHPAVAQYNNMKTEGGYSSNYPINKKHHFLNLLGEKWAKENPENLKYIKSWGSRLYVFNDQFQNQIRYKWDAEVLQETELRLNWKLIREAGVQYLLSANPVLDEEITLIEVFKDSSSAWKIYAYKIKA